MLGGVFSTTNKPGKKCTNTLSSWDSSAGAQSWPSWKFPEQLIHTLRLRAVTAWNVTGEAFKQGGGSFIFIYRHRKKKRVE